MAEIAPPPPPLSRFEKILVDNNISSESAILYFTQAKQLDSFDRMNPIILAAAYLYLSLRETSSKFDTTQEFLYDYNDDASDLMDECINMVIQEAHHIRKNRNANAAIEVEDWIKIGIKCEIIRYILAVIIERVSIVKEQYIIEEEEATKEEEAATDQGWRYGESDEDNDYT